MKINNIESWNKAMNTGELLLSNMNKVHTTRMGEERIKRNLCLQVDDVVSWCIDKIKDPNSYIYKEGKNWYIILGDYKFTVNAHSYTIITAHKIKSK